VRVSNFTLGRSIYWSSVTGAHLVYGDIGLEYTATANDTDYFGTPVQQILGAPTSDEMDVPGVGGARMNGFQGGNIYWSADTGAHVVYGGIGARYDQLGGPAGYLGLPVSDEQGIAGGAEDIYGNVFPDKRVSYFQNGQILWTAAGGAYDVPAVSQLDFDGQFSDSGSYGGWAHITLYADGIYHFTGHAYDEGFDSYSYSVSFRLQSISGATHWVTHDGSVSGPLGFGSWDDPIDQWGTIPGASSNWTDWEGAQANFVSTFTDVGPFG
jgi:uncharacterized protein with LGFP repeats